MRISDWSSDVCSSDLGNGGAISPDFCVPIAMPGMLRRLPRWLLDPEGPLVVRWSNLPASLPWLLRWIRAGRIERVDRKSVVWGKRVSVRVDLGGRRIIKKKKLT